ncbi:hypothetical protein E2P64_00290 [Candidatus Bathyarchaeota archaeon]|nr:hypothetical protein E2P64_00290 [Candidatus Bathyarchaeota archaeon]
MGRLKRGQVSPDFAMSAMIFSLAALFIFFHLTRTYYTRVWEVSRAESMAAAQNLALFLTSEEGSWADNPFESDAIAFGGSTLNETRMNYFFGMPYQTAQDRLKMYENFRIEAWKLPNIGITSDIVELYPNNTVDIQVQTTENTTLYLVMVGTQGGLGYTHWNQSVGQYHGFSWILPTGVYSLKALATSGEKYGAYEATFRVI